MEIAMPAANPVLLRVRALAAEGWHPSSISIEREGERWIAMIERLDFMRLGAGCDPAPIGDYRIKIDHEQIPEGVSLLGLERLPAIRLPLPLATCRDDVERWIDEIARAGGAPDYAWIGERVVTKPIVWLPEDTQRAIRNRHA
jgi:hypothetical protein